MIALLVALFGGLGAALRFVVDGAVRARWSGVGPLATVVVNISGSWILGLVVGIQLFQGFSSVWFTAVTIGLCGGYTTFSTASVEVARLLQAGEVRAAVLNALGGLAACVGAVALGLWIAWIAS
ncbi:CrcB family protein [Actinotalea sp. K2]|uniref:fluoride efflux transporter FluC n=1 Tax=Actinotalea sp. K2 TaxID=2939438 RepID=UPI002016C3E3|nr:CrcB family protein [Actinotalea sp. K2]MCL3861122.1 CrcB family protein [Actinotalea sp. K2]